MAAPITEQVGHSAALSIIYLDANGNPMLTPVVPDADPVWTQSTPATDTLTVGPGGTTASEVGLVAGTDMISLSVVVGGATFTATLPLTVTAAPQILTSVDIAAVVS